MNRKRRLSFSILGLTASVSGVLFWTLYKEFQQQRLNHALMEAIKRDDAKHALALLDRGADPNATDKPEIPSLEKYVSVRLHGRKEKPDHAPTAFYLSLAWKNRRGQNYEAVSPPENIPLLKAMLKHGAKVNVLDAQGMDPLFFPLIDGKNATIRLLLAKGAAVNFTYFGDPRLCLAVMHNIQPDILEAMLKRGANVNEKDGLGFTALHYAVIREQSEVVRLLLAYHADVTIKARQGEGVLELANGNEKITQMLRDAGAKE